jgi:hypothetical protein
MNKAEHIWYHEDKINRLYEERDKLQAKLHETTSDNRKIFMEDLFFYTKKFSEIDRDLRVSIEIRMTLLNLEA